MTDHGKVVQIYRDIIKAGVLEDRFEYEPDDLQASYSELTTLEVEFLFGMIQGAMLSPDWTEGKDKYGDIDVHMVLDIPPQVLHDLIEGALMDTDLEGWTAHERKAIVTFLKDLVQAHRHS